MISTSNPFISRIVRMIAVALAAAAVTLGCLSASSSTDPVVVHNEFVAPQRLSETGLYDREGKLDPRNQPFVPQYPLWTDGAVKSRWIYLPEGAQIDVSDIDAWKFPAGTKLWKEFAWNGRRVETRMIWKPTDTNWVFATYVWNEEQTEAILAPQDGVPAFAEIAPGKRHSIPSLADCQSCHGSAPATVLGFNALQLSDDRDPLAPHREPDKIGALTLQTLIETNRLTPERRDLIARPPRIRANTPTARAAMGYLSANCGGCHNSSGPLARLGLNLLHNVGGHDQSLEPAILTALNSRGRFVIPGIAPDSSYLVVAGEPEHSAIWYRMNSRRPSSQMPPLGTIVVDSQAVSLVREWISSLDTPPLP